MRRPTIPQLPPSAVRLALAGALSAGALALGGCLMQPSFSANVTTADGVQIEVPLTSQMPVIEDAAVIIRPLHLTPMPMDGAKGLVFGLDLEFKHGAKPVSIAVDDVSDTPILSVYVDNAPQLSKGGQWRAISPPHATADPLVGWLANLDSAVKVYRFTVKLSDGTTHVLHYGIFFHSEVKKIMRAGLGMS